MKFFGKKKNKNKATPTKSSRQEQPRQQLKPPQTTVVKYVGESKHVTTNRIDENGHQITETHVIQLTAEEMEELGIVPKAATVTAAPKDQNAPASADLTSGDHIDDQSMAGYSLGGFSDIVPPPSFTDSTAKSQNLKHCQPPSSSTNIMIVPVDEVSSSSSSSKEGGGVSVVDEVSLEEKMYQKKQQERQVPVPPPQRQKNIDEPATSSTRESTPISANVSVDNHSASTSATEEYMAAIEVTRELVKKFISDIWNRGEIDLIPSVCHPSLRFNGHVGMDRVGHEGFARMVTTVREALSDYHCEVHSMVVESTKAFCRLRFTGKHTGNLLGYPPTGKTVAWMGASEFTCKNGKILKVWELGDLKSLEEQLRNDN
jgi:predicted ester cyclase